jgi:glyoxylase-like metal-dependent hydrolase (beta-lactamase superfamily II)
MQQSKEIAPGIHRIAGIFDGSRIVFCHLLVGAGRSMLVDTGMSHTPQADIFPYMKSIGFDPASLDFVLITHSDIDHQAGNEEVRKAAPNALFIAHNLDVPWIESAEALVRGRYAQFIPDHGIGPDEATQQDSIADCPCHVPIDICIDGGEQIRLARDWVVELVHTPGHTWGHTGVYDPRSKTFLAAEAALWNAILDKDWQPALPPTYCYVDTYLSTIERLRGMNIQTYSGAHWPLKYGNDVGAFLDESKNYCLHVEAKLLESVRATRKPITMRELIDQLKPTLGTWPANQDENLAFAFNGNLHRLEDRNLILRTRTSDNRAAWTSA